ncbi:MAG: glycosyltransferase [Alkalibacterium sp.]|nr:glycosyltransferase [Alkalibacterium sp.]
MTILKYSVLMSVYAGENPYYFKQSIESMLNQSLPPDEIIIVKDGMLTVDLENIVEGYKTIWTNIFTIVSLETNVGLGRALNEGIKISRNELIARMDTDDISKINRCEVQVNQFLKDKDLDILGTKIDEFYNSPDEIVSSRLVPIEHKEILRFSRRRNPFNHPTVMFKKSSVLNNGGYKNYRRNQDLDLFVQMINNGCKSKNIDESLLLFRANKDNLIRRKSWEKCSSYIKMIYNFWRKGYSSFNDLIFVTITQCVFFISPPFVLEWISSNFLRKKY